MRICLYTSTALPLVGGQEVVVDALARGFQAEGHDVVVLAPRCAQSRAFDRRQSYRIVRHPRFVSTWRFVDWYRQALLRHDRRFRFDIVHGHGIYPTGYVAVSCRPRLGCPVVLTSHGEDVYAGYHRLQNPMIRERCDWTLANANGLFAISQFTRDGYRRLSPDSRVPIHMVSNGVDTAGLQKPASLPAPLREAGLRPNNYLLAIGRLTRQKGLDLLLRARFESGPRCSLPLVVAGDGPERPSLEREVQRLGWTDRVFFAGMVQGDDKRALLQHARCVVVPSRDWEGSPVVVVEAMACGTPVIASRLPAIVERVDEGVTGYLFPPEDPTALARLLERAAGEPDVFRRLGGQAQDAVEAFAWPRVVEQHLSLYQSTVRAFRDEPHRQERRAA